MKRSSTNIANNDNDTHLSLTTTTNGSGIIGQQHKRSLEDYGFLANMKRRRHLSPQNANIDMIDDTSTTYSSKRKKPKSKTRSAICDLSIDTHVDHNSNSTCDSQTSRKSSSRLHPSTTFTSQQLNDVNLPNWERICTNIDQILSSKHTQSGVFAHEINLVQQELESLLSMAIVREKILTNVLHPSSTNDIRGKIRQHQEAERVYSSKPLRTKQLPPLLNHQHHRQNNNSHVILDRQVSMAPVIGARIDRIWSEINTNYRKISSNDLDTIENLVDFDRDLADRVQQYKQDYHSNHQSSPAITEQLQEENFQPILSIAQTNPVLTRYVDRTTLGRFQEKLHEHIPHTSPVYKTPTTSPTHREILSTSLRFSPRLHAVEHTNNRQYLVALPNLKPDDDIQPQSSSSIKSKKKTKNGNGPIFSSSPPSSVKLQQRFHLVRTYLADQHPLITDTVKRQLFNEMKTNKNKKKTTTTAVSTATTSSNHTSDSIDPFESKLSTLASFLQECSTLSMRALKRARLQADSERTWQQLLVIERDVEPLVQKLDTTTSNGNGNSSNANNEKMFNTLAQLLTERKKCEDELERHYQQLEQTFNDDE